MSEPFPLFTIWRARERIRPYIWRTPLLHSPSLSRQLGGRIFLKMECWQVCGSFKIRGLMNRVASLDPVEREKGLVAASCGNQGISLAYLGRLLGVPVTIFLPRDADPSKVTRIQGHGADTVLVAESIFEAGNQAREYAKQNDRILIRHDHADVIAGHGTTGLEILEDLPEADIIAVPVGAGGLCSGIGGAVKTVSPSCVIVGVEPSAAPGTFLSLQEGVCCERITIKPSLADGLLGGPSPVTFPLLQRWVEQVVVVEEEEILLAMRTLLEQEQLVVEGSGAVGLAALLAGRIKMTDKNVVLVITGRNVDPQRWRDLMDPSKGEMKTHVH
jgi:threonine dehydratase